MAALTLLAFVLGLLLVVQLRAQGAAGGLGQLSAQDLTTLIANLNLRNGQLRTEIADLEAQLRSLSSVSTSGETNVEQLGSDLRRLRSWGGLGAVRGRGVEVTLSGPITADAVNDLVDELRVAGAEALSIGGVRVVSGTVVAGEPGGLTVAGSPLEPEFVVAAIGAPSALQAILNRPGGIVGRIVVTQPDVVVEVLPSEAPLTLPATTRDLVPADAKPRI